MTSEMTLMKTTNNINKQGKVKWSKKLRIRAGSSKFTARLARVLLPGKQRNKMSLQQLRNRTLEEEQQNITFITA